MAPTTATVCGTMALETQIVTGGGKMGMRATAAMSPRAMIVWQQTIVIVVAAVAVAARVAAAVAAVAAIAAAVAAVVMVPPSHCLSSSERECHGPPLPQTPGLPSWHT